MLIYERNLFLHVHYICYNKIYLHQLQKDINKTSSIYKSYLVGHMGMDCKTRNDLYMITQVSGERGCNGSLK